MVLQEMEPELQLESVLQETLGSERKWLFLLIQPEQVTVTDLMTTPPLTALWDISSSFKEQVIIITVLYGKVFWKMTNVERAQYVPLQFSVAQWWVPGLSSGWRWVPLILTAVLEAGGGVLISVPPQRPFFRLSILFSCFMDARFSHTTASFYTNGKLTHPF